MDLNLLYSRHQISLIRASSALDAASRAFHATLAEGFARRIKDVRSQIGARDAAADSVGPQL